MRNVLRTLSLVATGEPVERDTLYRRVYREGAQWSVTPFAANTIP